MPEADGAPQSDFLRFESLAGFAGSDFFASDFEVLSLDDDVLALGFDESSVDRVELSFACGELSFEDVDGADDSVGFASLLSAPAAFLYASER